MDLVKLNEKIDELLETETAETLIKWLDEKRVKTSEKVKLNIGNVTHRCLLKQASNAETREKVAFHRCLLKPCGEKEMRCKKCGYVTFRDDTKTVQQIIEQMIKDGYPKPSCSNGG